MSHTLCRSGFVVGDTTSSLPSANRTLTCTLTCTPTCTPTLAHEDHLDERYFQGKSTAVVVSRHRNITNLLYAEPGRGRFWFSLSMAKA